MGYVQDEWLFNQYNTSGATNSEIQYAIWSIMDPGTINASNSSYNNAGAFDATAQHLAAQAATMAATLPASYFANDIALLPDPDWQPYVDEWTAADLHGGSDAVLDCA